MPQDDNKIPIKVNAPVTQQPVPQDDANEIVTMHSPEQTIHPTAHDIPLDHVRPDIQPLSHYEKTIAEPQTSPVAESAASEPVASQAMPHYSHVVAHPHSQHSPAKSILAALLTIIVTLLILPAGEEATIYFFKI